MAISRAADYGAAGFGGELGFGVRPAVVVVDLMRAYFDRSSPMYAGVEDVLEACLRVVAAAHAARAPVYLTRQIFDEPDDRGVYVRKVPALKLLRPGSGLAELHPALSGAQGQVIVKRFPSAFHGTGFAERLSAPGVDTLLILGLTTSGCIRATAMDCLLHGLRGIVIREAVGDRDPGVHEANLFDIDAKLADVRGEKQVVEWLRSVGQM
ncbi:MAG TPA: isochorismatase family protein [Casimicrobiaceae bacterium]